MSLPRRFVRNIPPELRLTQAQQARGLAMLQRVRGTRQVQPGNTLWRQLRIADLTVYGG